MAKIYAPPEKIKPIPEMKNFMIDGHFNFKKMEAAEEIWTNELRKWCIANSPGHKHIGKIIREPVADGYALYMIFSLKPLAFIHLPLGDGYQFQWAHRWTVSDVNMMINKDETMRKIFGKKRIGI